MSSLVAYESSADSDDDADVNQVMTDAPAATTATAIATDVSIAAAPPRAASTPDHDHDDDDDDDVVGEEEEEEEEDSPTPEPSFSASPPAIQVENPPQPEEQGANEHDDKGGERDEGGDDENQPGSKSARRIRELDQVQHDMGRLLHFAGCTLASLHPDPLRSFTDQKVPLPPDDGKQATIDSQDKTDQFDRYAEAFYTTLNDIQLSLRTSIRHLRLSRASPNALLDPHYASLLPTISGGGGAGGTDSGTSASSVGAGGVAHGTRLDPLPTTKTVPKWMGGSGAKSSEISAPASESRLSVAAMELQAEAWRELGEALQNSPAEPK